MSYLFFFSLPTCSMCNCLSPVPWHDIGQWGCRPRVLECPEVTGLDRIVLLHQGQSDAVDGRKLSVGVGNVLQAADVATRENWKKKHQLRWNPPNMSQIESLEIRRSTFRSGTSWMACLLKKNVIITFLASFKELRAKLSGQEEVPGAGRVGVDGCAQALQVGDGLNDAGTLVHNNGCQNRQETVNYRIPFLASVGRGR